VRFINNLAKKSLDRLFDWSIYGPAALTSAETPSTPRFYSPSATAALSVNAEACRT
jgi:hypothetical protein